MKTIRESFRQALLLGPSEAYLEGMKTRNVYRLMTYGTRRPKPTSKEWKLLSTSTLSRIFSVRSLPRRNENFQISTSWLRKRSIVRSLPRRNENRLSVDVHNHLYIVRSLPRRNENFLYFYINVTLGPVRSLPRRNENWIYNTDLWLYNRYVRSLPRRNENIMAKSFFLVSSLSSEAYLEGMKTRIYFFFRRNLFPSEAYLEGMKT